MRRLRQKVGLTQQLFFRCVYIVAQQEIQNKIDQKRECQSQRTSNDYAQWDAGIFRRLGLVGYLPMRRQFGFLQTADSPQLIRYILNQRLQLFFHVHLVLAFEPQEQTEVVDLNDVGLSLDVLKKLVERIEKLDAGQVFTKVLK